MLDNPFVLLLLVCGTPLAGLGLAFAAGYLAAKRGYHISRRGGGGRAPAESGPGYAVAGPPIYSEAPRPRGTGPLVERIAQVEAGRLARQ